MKIFSKNAWGVDVNNVWPLTCKASCLKKNIELRPLISGFDFTLLEVRNLCVASPLKNVIQKFNAYTIDEKYTQQYVYTDILFSYKQFQLQEQEQRQYNMY